MQTIAKLALTLLCISKVQCQWYTTPCYYWYYPYYWCTSIAPRTVTQGCVWDDWTECSATCGPSGTQTAECKLGDTVVQTDQRECNRYCINGTLANGYCSCPLELTGTCCELTAESDVQLSHSVAGSEILFHCDFDYNGAPQSFSLSFEWFVGDTVVFDEMKSSTPARSTMKQANWEGKMGSQIRCEVDISENSVYVGRKRSSSFWAGINVEAPDVIDVYENDDSVAFELVPTVPFLCRSNCAVKIPVTITNRSGRYGSYVDAVAQDQCGAYMMTDNSEGPFTIRVKARRDFFSDGDGEVQLEFQAISTQEAPLWNNYKISGTITVRTHDRDRWSRKCSGTGDPHYYTFDGMYFHVYYPGEYIYYRHETMPFEVQTRLKPCGRVACNCGVAARAEDDIIIVDRCKIVTEEVVYYWRGQRYSYFMEYGKLTIKIITNGIMTPGFKLIRQNSGRTYKIYFPTGAYVEIEGTYYLNVYFSPGSDDYGWKNLGLCGSYDTDYSNDLLHGPVTSLSKIYSPAIRDSVAHNFSTTWRVPAGKNLFYGELDTFEKNNVSNVYCTCTPNSQDGSPDEVCDNGKDNGRPAKSQNTCNARYCDVTNEYLDTQDAGRRKRNAFNRRRREATTDDDLAFEYDENFEYQVPSWPTVSGITETQAQEECFQQIRNTTIGRSCANVLDDDEVDEFIEACKIDIQVLDDLTQAKVSRDLLTAQCEEVLSKNSTFWEDNGNADGTFGPPRSILGVMCPSDCNGKGDCSDGVCTCYPGYGGTDCSTNLNEAPQIYRSGKSGLCDSSEESCTNVKIYGDNYVESPDLTCHVTHVEISESGFTMADTAIKVAAVYSTYEEARCPIEDSARKRRGANSGVAVQPVGALVSISNDGTMESAQVLAIIYDSNCDVCNGTYGYCSRKTDICIVDGECYNLNDPMCQQGTKTWIIVGAVLGSVVAVCIVVVVTVVCVKKKAKKNARVASTAELVS